MVSFDTKQFSKDQQVVVNGFVRKTEYLQSLKPSDLLRMPASGGWSVAQVVEHLNSYNRYYLRQIEKVLQRARAEGMKPAREFRSGWLGNYFANSMAPGADGKVASKMKSPNDHVPPAELDVALVLKEFTEGEQRLIDFLQQSERVDPGKLRVPISLSRFVKLKLGDTFRFLIAHQERHFAQIARIMKDLDNVRGSVESKGAL